MKEIATDILIETDYEGVTVGAIRTPEGVVMVDTPISSKDASAWRTNCTRTAAGSDRLLVLLDEHFDRISGASNIKCPVIVHEKTSQAVSSRPATKNQPYLPMAANWETNPEPLTTRWVHAEITFTVNMAINWGESPILLEHHPGPSKGSTWVVVPDRKVAFIGDTVTPGQPPFLSNADIEAWLLSLHDLQLARFKDFLLVSGRDSLATLDDIKELEHILKKIARRIEKLVASKAKTEEAEMLADEILADFKPANKHEAENFKNRLSVGLVQYYSSHHSKKSD
jgi:glyoxylase-like metal-dependent hydrolase (beta-lactamase superfamily II)